MKPLAETFQSNQFSFQMLKREGRVAVFQKTKPDIDRKFYEVVIVQSHHGYEIAGTHYPPAEYMPRSEDWGKSGWSYSNRESAEVRFNSLSGIA